MGVIKEKFYKKLKGQIFSRDFSEELLGRQIPFKLVQVLMLPEMTSLAHTMCVHWNKTFIKSSPRTGTCIVFS